MRGRVASWCLAMALCSTGIAQEPIELTLRQRQPDGQGGWIVKEQPTKWDPAKTAIILCDFWDDHWCKGAARRVGELAPRVDRVLKAMRDRGVFVIHAPSDTMAFYDGTPQRKLAQSAPAADAKVPLQRWCGLNEIREGKLPIDDSDGGCDDDPPCPQGSPWTRQHPAVEIAEGDAITDSEEAYNLLQQRGIEHVLVLGVHTNMCVLGRSFAIRQLEYQGKDVVLIRDLTDTMYNSRMPPKVSHFDGTNLMIEHIEKHWCPTITSDQLIGGERFRFKGAPTN
jgi:nicotinamidase-related amidase